MLVPSQIAGVILAGGRSRRFGGGDKGLSDLGGKPVLAHVIERFQPQVGRLVLNANGDMSRFAGFGLDVIADNESPECGPLSGILAALDWAAQQSADFKAIATVSTDVPFLPADLVQKLESARGAGLIARLPISLPVAHAAISTSCSTLSGSSRRICEAR